VAPQSERGVVICLSFNELTAVVAAIDEQARNASGLLTEQGIRFHKALLARLDPIWGACESSTPPDAANDGLEVA